MKKRNLSFCLLVLVFLLTVSTLLCGSAETGKCPVCGGEYDETSSRYIHEGECPLCGNWCHYGEYTDTCPHCRATCNGESCDHRPCSNCGAPCDGSGYDHIPCPYCGAECVAEASSIDYFYNHKPDCQAINGGSSAPTLSPLPNNPAPSSPSSRPYEGPTDVTVAAPEKEVPATGSDPLVTVIIAANIAVVATLAVVLFRKKASDR